MNLLHTLTSDSWQSVLMFHYLCHKRSYQIQKELHYSCTCLWFMCQLEFATRYQNYDLNRKPYHSDSPQMRRHCFMLHGWIIASWWQRNLSAMYLIKQNGTGEAEGNRKPNRPTDIYKSVCWKNVSVSHKKRNDEDWQKSSASSFKVITAKRMINVMLCYVTLIHWWKIFLVCHFCSI